MGRHEHGTHQPRRCSVTAMRWPCGMEMQENCTQKDRVGGNPGSTTAIRPLWRFGFGDDVCDHSLVLSQISLYRSYQVLVLKGSAPNFCCVSDHLRASHIVHLPSLLLGMVGQSRIVRLFRALQIFLLTTTCRWPRIGIEERNIYISEGSRPIRRLYGQEERGISPSDVPGTGRAAAAFFPCGHRRAARGREPTPDFPKKGGWREQGVGSRRGCWGSAVEQAAGCRHGGERAAGKLLEKVQP